MKKDGNALKMSVGQFAELIAAVTRALPRDMDSTTGQMWIDNPQALQKILCEALMSSVKTESDIAFPLKVNYDLSVESLVAHGKYDWKNDNITTNNFPTVRKGEANLVLELVHFNKVLTSEEVLKELDKMGYRPAELHELLSFGEKYPDIQRQFTVFALGSLWRYWNGDRLVPYLRRCGGGRGLDLSYFSYGWGGRCRFAAVRKSAQGG